MLGLRTIHQFRSTPSSQLVAESGAWCTNRFDHTTGVPVLIAARNEAHDLPATLLSLAHSRVSVSPVVIENGSEDDTARYAEEMGALVLRSELPAKMAALQLGVSYVAGNRSDANEVLFTDADTLVGPDWVAAMKERLGTTAADSAIATAGCIFTHGEKLSVDTARSLNILTKRVLSQVLKKDTFANGNNMAIRFGDNETIDAYNSLDPLLFVGEEKAITDIVVANGGKIEQTMHPASIVATRGDRFSSLGECLKIRKSSLSRRDQYPEYGEFNTYEA